jgi:hypothetical protein
MPNTSTDDVNGWLFTQLRSVTQQLRSQIRSHIFQKPLAIAILYIIIRNIRSKKGIGVDESISKLFLLDPLLSKSYVNYVTMAMHVGFNYVNPANLLHRYVLQ